MLRARGCWHFYVVKQHCQFGPISTKNGYIHFPRNTTVAIFPSNTYGILMNILTIILKATNSRLGNLSKQKNIDK